MVGDGSRMDNSAEGLKLAIRRWLWEEIPERRVLDLYCGKDGRMWEGIWRDAESYLGCDKFRPHNHTTTLKMSAERAVQSLDLDSWTIFDIDPYASPWVVGRRILLKRGAGTYGLALTSGEERGLKNGSSNEIIRRSIGASGLSDYRLLLHYRDLVFGLMLRSLADIPGITLKKGVKVTGAGPSKMLYFAMVIESERNGKASPCLPQRVSGRALGRLAKKRKNLLARKG